MAKNYIQYTSRIKSSTADGILLESDQMVDEAKGKLQSVINKEVDTSLAAKANAADVYKKTEVDTKLAAKANSADVYKKTETYSKSEVDTKVSQSISTVYRPMGSKATIAEVIALTDAKVGDVWDVKAEFTLGGKKYPASTNVVCVTATTTSAHTDANWDALGGTVDLTPYAKTADMTAKLGTKVDKVAGKGLSTNDYTTAEKTKLAGIAAGAQVNAVTSVAGKTGAVVLTKTDVGLSNVDNTSDANKPISTATQAALDLKADKADVYEKSEVDTKLAAKANAADVYKKTEVDTKLGTKANSADVYKKTETYSKSEVDTKVAQSISTVYRPMGSKATIAEVIALTDAKVGDVWDVKAEFTLGGKKYPASTNVVCVTATTTSSHTDANWDALGGTVDLTPYAKTADMTAKLGTKVDKVEGKGLSTNDYTTAEKTKLSRVPKYMFGAEGNPGQLLTVAPESNNIKLNFGGRNTTTGESNSYPYVLPSATNVAAGVMSAADKKKVDSCYAPNFYSYLNFALLGPSSSSDAIKKALTPTGGSTVVFPKIGDVFGASMDNGYTLISANYSSNDINEAFSYTYFLSTAFVIISFERTKSTDTIKCVSKVSVDLANLIIT